MGSILDSLCFQFHISLCTVSSWPWGVFTNLTFHLDHCRDLGDSSDFRYVSICGPDFLFVTSTDSPYHTVLNGCFCLYFSRAFKAHIPPYSPIYPFPLQCTHISYKALAWLDLRLSLAFWGSRRLAASWPF